MSSPIGPRPFVTVDGNEAAAYVAHKLSEVIAIYPTPRRRPWASSPISGAPSTGHGDLQRLRALDEELQHSSRGLHGLHVLTWPCQRLL
jgi:hypothetical protein